MNQRTIPRRSQSTVGVQRNVTPVAEKPGLMQSSYGKAKPLFGGEVTADEQIGHQISFRNRERRYLPYEQWRQVNEWPNFDLKDRHVDIRLTTFL